jgi:hypothetical protein
MYYAGSANQLYFKYLLDRTNRVCCCFGNNTEIASLDVPLHLIKVGKMIQDGWADKAKKHGLKIHISGIYPLSHFEFTANNPLLHKTVFTKIMLEYGFLASTVFYSSYAHKENIVNSYVNAVDKTFGKMSVMTEPDMMKFVDGKVCHSGFKRLN